MPAIENLVHETSTSTGTGSFTLSAADGRQSFNAAFGTGGTDAFYYFLSHRTAGEWEVGTGHLSDATTLVRDSVLASSNANAVVDFSAGTKDVTNDLPAGQVANQVLTTQGDLLVRGATSLDRVGIGSSGQAIQSNGFGLDWSQPSTEGSIAGIVPSLGLDSDHDLDFSAGSARSRENTSTITMAPITKRFDSTWTVGSGNGGMQSGSSLPTNGTVHVYAMRRSDTGVSDMIGVPYGSTLILPTDYDSSRRVFSFTTDASSNIIGFDAIECFGGALDVYLHSVVEEFSGNFTTARTNLTLSVPQGLNLLVRINAAIHNAVTAIVRVFATKQDGGAVDQSKMTLQTNSGSAIRTQTEMLIRTNTAAQIDYDASTTVQGSIRTNGWFDYRR